MPKIFRRLAWLLTVALLLNLMLPGFVFAAETNPPTFEVGSLQGKPGDTVEIPIQVKNSPGIASIKFSLSYDKNALKLTDANVSISKGNTTNSPTIDVYPYILNWVGGTYVHPDPDFTFATLTFLVLENAAPGHKDINISYSPDDVFDGNEENISFFVKNGGIAIPHTSVTATVDAPAKGTALDTTVDVGGATAYTGTAEWYKGTSVSGTAVTGLAEASQVYTVKISLTADEGEVFDASLNGTSTPDGFQITKVSDTELTLIKTFPATQAKELQALEVITPPSTTTYTHGEPFNPKGMAVKATYDDNTVDENFTGYTIEYASAGKNYLKKDDTKVTLKSGNQSVEINNLTVNPKNLTVSGLTAENRTYDGSTAVALSGGILTGAVSGESVSAAMPTSGTIADANVGSNKQVTIPAISLTGTDAGNYTLTQPTVTVTIRPKALTNPMITLGTQKTYSGTEQNVVITSVQDGSKPLTKDTDYTIVSGDKATNVGSTTLTISGKGNYSGSATAVWSLQKATPSVSDFTVTVPNSEGVPYTGSPISVAPPTTAKTGMGTITVKYGNNTTAPANVGSYTVTFDVADGTNYTAASGLAIGTLKINRAEYSGTKTANVTVRSDLEASNKKVALPDLPDGASYGTVRVTTSNGLLHGIPTVSGTELTCNINSKPANTTEKITVAVTGAANYNDYLVEVTFLTKDRDDASVTVTPANSTVKYGENVTLTASKTNSGTGTWSWTYPNDSFEVIGAANTASITLKAIKASANAKTVSVKFESDTHMGTASAIVTVNKAASAVSVAPTAKTGLSYTGSAQALVNAGTAVGGELQYNVDDGAYSTAVPSGTNAKNYTVNYKVLGDANHEDSTAQHLTVVIAKADPDIGTVSKSGPDTIYPHTKLDRITLSKTNAIEGTLSLNESQILAVGTKEYEWTFVPADTNNYNVKSGTVSLTVTEDKLASISVTTPPTKITYKYGETLDTNGAVITAAYDSSATRNVTAEAVFTPVKLLTVGSQTITVAYGGKNTEFHVTVEKADAKPLADLPVNLKINVTAEQTVTLDTTGMPSDAGTLTYTKGTEEKTGSVTVTGWSVDPSTGEVKYALSGAEAGDTVILPVIVSSTNYADSIAKIKITLIGKDVPTVTVQDITCTYTGKNVPADAIVGTATFNGQNVEGTWSWKTASELTNVRDSGTKTVIFTPADNAAYATVEANLTLTINKATPTGTPSFTKITASGKTLADAELNAGDITPAGGSITWNDGDSKTVEANTAYSWTYTPADADNYNVLSGSITPYQRSSGGGGGGGSSTSATTRYKITAPSNSKNGKVTISPSSAKKGDTVTITATPDDGFQVSSVTVKDSKGKEIAVTKANDGTFTFTMPNSTITVQAEFEKAPVEQKPEPKLNFSDVPADAYYYDAVAWAVENGITTGTSNSTFSPNASCTRAQMVTFLWRAAGSPKPQNSSQNPFQDVPNDAYFHDAVLWAAEQGITSGTSPKTFSPNTTVSRGQTTAFLYKFAGSPNVSGGHPFSDSSENDYFNNAVTWAVNNKITSGTSETTFSPNADCSRAQIMTFLFLSQKK